MKKGKMLCDIEYMLQRIFIANEIPVQVYDLEDKLLIQLGIKKDGQNPFSEDSLLLQKIRTIGSAASYPVIEIEDSIFAYGAFTDTDYCYIYGPVALENPSLSKLHDYRKRHGIRDREYKVIKKSLINLANALSMTIFIVKDLKIEEKTILRKNEKGVEEAIVGDKEINQYQFEKAEQDAQHFSYQYEQRYLDAVENGNIDFFKDTLVDEPSALQKVGLLARSSEKQLEYMIVSSTVLVTRAAIRGGLPPSSAYALSELYLQKLEKCQNLQEILSLHQTMRLDFVNKVREQKEKKRNEDYIEACKDYLSQRVHYPVRIKELADALGMNHSYLSKKFKEKEGMTIIQYSINAKLKAAANMLKYSEASIAQVTDYFCFSSQSKFSGHFKKKYGVTPMMYRKENKVIEFLTTKDS